MRRLEYICRTKIMYIFGKENYCVFRSIMMVDKQTILLQKKKRKLIQFELKCCFLSVFLSISVSVRLSFFPYSHLFLRQRQRCPLKEKCIYPTGKPIENSPPKYEPSVKSSVVCPSQLTLTTPDFKKYISVPSSPSRMMTSPSKQTSNSSLVIIAVTKSGSASKKNGTARTRSRQL